MPAPLRRAPPILFAWSLYCLLALPAIAQQDDERVRSPEVGDDGRVTFRLRAAADEVMLSSGGDIPQIPFGEGLPLEQGRDDIWTLTLGPMDPGSYRYVFMVDGVRTVDPGSAGVSESNDNAWSLFHVPGADFMDALRVPHGTVAEVNYYSEELGRHRRMHVYTPPGYQRDAARYPVLYLLHGAMDSDDSWHTVGRAGFILDNLIAEGKAEPMIVAMPAGHTRSFSMGQSELPIEEFTSEFRRDIKPYIEDHYRVSTARGDTAIAGLSMGGAHTLEIAFSALSEYAYIGVFSSGVFGVTDNDDWEQAHLESLRKASLKEGLERVWFATGEEDFVLDTSRATVDLLRGHGFEVEYEEGEGGHTWSNWRNYLHSFAQGLFK